MWIRRWGRGGGGADGDVKEVGKRKGWWGGCWETGGGGGEKGDGG